MLRLGHSHWLQIVGHAYDGLPYEACGLLAGDPETGTVHACYPCRNVAKSSKVYEIGPEYIDHEDAAAANGWQLLGVFHSHTHTDAYPSPTDVEKAAVAPAWHYVILSLKAAEPVLRSYRIVDGKIAEEPVVLESR